VLTVWVEGIEEGLDGVQFEGLWARYSLWLRPEQGAQRGGRVAGPVCDEPGAYQSEGGLEVVRLIVCLVVVPLGSPERKTIHDAVLVVRGILGGVGSLRTFSPFQDRAAA
jgi:hypothetical protein